jgi:branched-subunit amino acid ABC-type transport system permease component
VNFPFWALLLSGLVTAGIYALAVTGFNLLILVGGVFYLVFTSIVVLCMYFLWIFSGLFGGNQIIYIPLAILAGVALVVLTEPIFRSFGQRKAIIASFIVAIGLSNVFNDIMTKINLGEAIVFDSNMLSRGIVLGTGLAKITVGQLATLLTSIAIVVALFYLIYRTKIGRYFRSIAQDSWAAKVNGVPIVRTSIISYVIAGAFAGIAAVLLAMYVGYARADLSVMVSMKVFMIVLLMGIGNLTGCLYGALIYGVAEAFMRALIPGEWSSVILYSVIFVLILCKPQGIFGQKVIAN